MAGRLEHLPAAGPRTPAHGAPSPRRRARPPRPLLHRPGTMTDLRLSVIICAYTLDRWDQLVEAVGSVHAPVRSRRRGGRRGRPQRRAARARAGERSPAASPRCCPTRSAAAWRVRATPASRHRRGDVVVFLDDDARADPALARGDVEALRRPGRHRGRRAGRAAVGRRCPGLVPARVRLGRRAAPTPASPSGRRRCATRSARTCPSAGSPSLAVGGFRVEVGRVGADALGGEETELSIRLAAALPRARASCTSRPPSCTTTCRRTAGAGPTTAGAAGPRASARRR